MKADPEDLDDLKDEDSSEAKMEKEAKGNGAIKQKRKQQRQLVK